MLRYASLFFAIVALVFLSAYPNEPIPLVPGAVGPYFNNVFTPRAPGNGLNFTLEDPLPGQSFYGPVRIIPFSGTEDNLLLGKKGEVWRINLDDQAAEKVLDLQDRCFGKGDAGATGIALHPRFADPTAAPEQRVVFLYYRHKPEPDVWNEQGYNRLSKFSWDEQNQRFDPESEEILIQQFDRHTWHNGGDLMFGPDGFLYFAVGDEGEEIFIEFSVQRLDGAFFNGVFRIDVDNDPERSRPILRQPRGLATPPAGWPETFSQGYGIPHDNPWISDDGSTLGEFYALGTRSPFSLRYDSTDNRIWIGDVGAGEMEEISTVEKGDNLQWPYREGTIAYPGYSRPDNLIGNDTPPVLGYGRTLGRSVTGGEVYRGSKFADLNGKYLFSDFIGNRLMCIDATARPGDNPPVTTLVADLRNEHPDTPQGAGVTGVHVQSNGDILILMLGSRMESIPGKIFRLRQIDPVPEPPSLLSELGVFTDLNTLETALGVLPYRTNSQLWSDRALKQRWLILPNDGTFDSADEQIDFRPTGEWAFPTGSVLVKHFELPLTTDPDGPVRRLETRFFIVGPQNSYGLSYHWNESGTDAVLASGPVSRDFEITDPDDGSLVFVQTWDYPGRGQCLQCHTAAADYTLGLSTHQLNGDLRYPEIGNTPVNQINYLASLGAFRQSNIPEPEDLPRTHAIDDGSANLDNRVRGYFDSNCSGCHRPGGVPNLGLDLRFSTPLPFTNIINVGAISHNSVADRLLVRPGDHQGSEIWHRNAAEDGSRMPPLGRNLLDEVWLANLATWIDGLPADAGENLENRVYPNPTNNVLSVRLRDDWAGPFDLSLFDLNGRLIHQTTFSNTAHQLELGFLSEGTYILRVAGGGEFLTRKVVVN